MSSIDLSKVQIGDRIFVEARIISVDHQDPKQPLHVDIHSYNLWVSPDEVRDHLALNIRLGDRVRLHNRIEGVIRLFSQSEKIVIEKDDGDPVIIDRSQIDRVINPEPLA